MLPVFFISIQLIYSINMKKEIGINDDALINQKQVNTNRDRMESQRMYWKMESWMASSCQMCERELKAR